MVIWREASEFVLNAETRGACRTSARAPSSVTQPRTRSGALESDESRRHRSVCAVSAEGLPAGAAGGVGFPRERAQGAGRALEEEARETRTFKGQEEKPVRRTGRCADNQCRRNYSCKRT